MSRAATKVAVSIPAELFRAVEQVRRSAIVQDAPRHWLTSQAEALLVREDEAGYRARPESPAEVRAAIDAALRFPLGLR